MARIGKTGPAAHRSASPAASRSQDALGTQGVDAARGLASNLLTSFTGMVHWLEQLQALNTSMLSGWSQALAQCARDLDQAKDPEQFMALPAQMVNHHLDQTSRQLAKAMEDLFEERAKWADQWRTQIARQMEQTVAAATQPGGGNSGVQPASFAAIGELQNQWLTMTRKWTDAMSASVPAQSVSSQV